MGSHGSTQARVNRQSAVDGEDEGQDLQEAREHFLDRARRNFGDEVVPTTCREPLSPYEMKAGWDIPTVLERWSTLWT